MNVTISYFTICYRTSKTRYGTNLGLGQREVSFPYSASLRQPTKPKHSPQGRCSCSLACLRYTALFCRSCTLPGFRAYLASINRYALRVAMLRRVLGFTYKIPPPTLCFVWKPSKVVNARSPSLACVDYIFEVGKVRNTPYLFAFTSMLSNKTINFV